MSEAEGEAIRTSEWPQVRHCQNAKAQLQREIVAATEAVNTGAHSPEALRNHFQPVLEHLIQLELRNNSWLGQQRETLEEERDQMNQSQRNLSQIRRSYGAGMVA